MISQRKKVLYFGLMLLMLCLVVEVVSVAGYRLATGTWLSLADLQSQRAGVIAQVLDELLEAEERGPLAPWQVLHPYLGFVLLPSTQAGGSNDYGFMGRLPPFSIGERSAASSDPRRPAVVAVVGGSLAQRMVDDAAELLSREIADGRCFEGRAVEVINLALPGVKQPQQLLTLNYFLSVGAVIDVLISLDGFNEVVLPIVENEAQGTFPFYPRNWKFQVAGLQDTELMLRVGEVEFWRELRKSVAAVFSGAPARYSATANTVWMFLDRAFAHNIAMKRVDLTLSQGAKGQGYLQRGPTRSYASEEAHYGDLVAVWERSTRLMHGASRAAGIASFHFLQPNQRVAGSKVFAPGEREIALPKRHGYDASARMGYPGLISAGGRMRAEGLPFDDLTMVFKDVVETIYTDGCCHVNPSGSKLMALEIARIIEQRFAAGQPCPEFR